METNSKLTSLYEDDSSLLLLQEEEQFTVNLVSNDNTTACTTLIVTPNSNAHNFAMAIEPCHEDTIVEENIYEQTLSALKSTDELIQLKRRKKRGNFNLRKSLAWNNAFFTEEGVLNQQELAILSGSHNKLSNMFLSGVPEEETDSVQEDPLSRGSDLQDLKGKFSYTSPLRPASKDVKLCAHSSPKVKSTLVSNSKTPRKLDLVKGVSKIPVKAGGCPRPSGVASQKRLPSLNLQDVPKKDMKIPKLSVSRPEQSAISAMPKIPALAEKNANNNRNRPVGMTGSLRKNILPKEISNTLKTTSSCKSLTTKSSIQHSRENTASNATTGLKILSDSVQTADASTSKVAIPLPQNTHNSCGKATNPQIHMTKPSGLRLPSPSLRYFAQTRASTCPSVSAPRKTQSCNSRGVGIPTLRKTGNSYHSSQMKPVHEPTVSLKTSDQGISSMKSLSSTTATTVSHPSLKLNQGHQRAVERSHASDHVNSNIELYSDSGTENSLEHQQGEVQDVRESIVDSDNRKVVSSELPQSEKQAEDQNLISLEVEKVQNKENHIPIAATTFSYPSLKLNRELEGSAMGSSQSHLVDLNMHTFVDSGVSNMLEHEKLKEEQQDLKNMDSHSSKAVSSELLPQAAEQTGYNRCTPHEAENIYKDHLILTATTTTCELEDSVQSCSIEQLQKVNCLQNSIDVRPGNEEPNASELEISQGLPLVNSEMRSSIVSGAEYLIEDKNGEELLESLKDGSSVVDIDNRKSMVYNDHLRELNISILENVRFEEIHIPQKNNDGFIEPDNIIEMSQQDNDLVNYSGKEPKNNISSKHSETTELSHNEASDAKLEFPAEDTEVLPLKRKSLDDCRQKALTLNPAPFTDQWLASLEEVGEEILTMKTGAVQNSPPDKSHPEPGPWSPVKRKKNVEIGPFDCTKHTNLFPPRLE